MRQGVFTLTKREHTHTQKGRDLYSTVAFLFFSFVFAEGIEHDSSFSFLALMSYFDAPR